ncbi:MAG: hypothetical protein HN421_03840 [Gammaproteobacteria bacterium]|nr:hypothetical protein [Gammaproteobacteria bacterium]MBT5372523.1 hypothetical protein [Gammaproteobacteria bacterium]MBT6477626.1 hypothetical protein [Gammaproteobacteria bacterium]MBT6878619.1 hypothetical protein [Gammaproteobacteria bacterium]HIJ25373.1 hypothetical protein [Gammaproteobacteria bacterium]
MIAQSISASRNYGAVSPTMLPSAAIGMFSCSLKRGDYQLYKDLLSVAAHRTVAEICCYCLMPNHVHLIIVPSDEDGLRRTFADAHHRYTEYINARITVTHHTHQ